MTDSGQADHFKLVFASARRAAILPPSEDQPPKVSHVGFGLVLGSDGKRYRTRSSEVCLSLNPKPYRTCSSQVCLFAWIPATLPHHPRSHTCTHTCTLADFARKRSYAPMLYLGLLGTCTLMLCVRRHTPQGLNWLLPCLASLSAAVPANDSQPMIGGDSAPHQHKAQPGDNKHWDTLACMPLAYLARRYKQDC